MDIVYKHEYPAELEFKNYFINHDLDAHCNFNNNNNLNNKKYRSQICDTKFVSVSLKIKMYIAVILHTVGL